jgi:protein-S-isoprenylcysteine O-methyltransferase Ste14
VTHPLGRLLIAAIGPALILLGFGDPAAFAAEPARVALVVALFVGRIAMGGAYRFKIDTTSEAKAQVLLPLTVITVTLAAALGLPYLDARPDLVPAVRLEASWVRWLGAGLFAGGIALQAWSTITLGKWFSPRIAIQPEHELIQTGPYRWIRHPFYTGLLACVAGFPAAFGSWIGFPVAAVTFGVVLYRVSVEERLLGEAFGDDFEALKARTKRLVPFIY